MGDLPAPYTTPDVDVRDFDGFMLNVERLMASELVALSTHEVIGAALFLWCRAWKQIPAASLPNDDRVLAAFCHLPLPRFRKLRIEILRGFDECSDGRIYHRVLSEEAIKAFHKRSQFKKKREADAERLRRWREAQRTSPDETPDETHFADHDETRFVASVLYSTGLDGTVLSEEEGKMPSRKDSPSADNRLVARDHPDPAPGKVVKMHANSTDQSRGQR